MNLVKNALAPFAYGVALAVVGFPFTTWQFWLLMPLAAVWAFIPERRRTA